MTKKVKMNPNVFDLPELTSFFSRLTRSKNTSLILGETSLFRFKNLRQTLNISYSIASVSASSLLTVSFSISLDLTG